MLVQDCKGWAARGSRELNEVQYCTAHPVPAVNCERGGKIDQEYRIILTCDPEERERWCNTRLVEQRVQYRRGEKKERAGTESTAGQTKLGSTGTTGRPKTVWRVH